MTAIIIPLHSTSLGERRSAHPSLELDNPSTRSEIVPAFLSSSSVRIITDLMGSEATQTEEPPAPTSRVYPHVFDESQVPGKALLHIRNALRDARAAADAFGEPNLSAVASHLSNVAASMSAAYPLTDFNESLGAVVAHIRRAALITPFENINRSALNALISALDAMAVNPLIDLSEASDLIEALADEGWNGEHELVDKLVTALTSSDDLDERLPQTLLFPAEISSQE